MKKVLLFFVCSLLCFPAFAQDTAVTQLSQSAQKSGEAQKTTSADAAKGLTNAAFADNQNNLCLCKAKGQKAFACQCNNPLAISDKEKDYQKYKTSAEQDLSAATADTLKATDLIDEHPQTASHIKPEEWQERNAQHKLANDPFAVMQESAGEVYVSSQTGEGLGQTVVNEKAARANAFVLETSNYWTQEHAVQSEIAAAQKAASSSSDGSSLEDILGGLFLGSSLGIISGGGAASAAQNIISGAVSATLNEGKSSSSDGNNHDKLSCAYASQYPDVCRRCMLADGCPAHRIVFRTNPVMINGRALRCGCE